MQLGQRSSSKVLLMRYKFVVLTFHSALCLAVCSKEKTVFFEILRIDLFIWVIPCIVFEFIHGYRNMYLKLSITWKNGMQLEKVRIYLMKSKWYLMDMRMYRKK